MSNETPKSGPLDSIRKDLFEYFYEDYAKKIEGDPQKMAAFKEEHAGWINERGTINRETLKNELSISELVVTLLTDMLTVEARDSVLEKQKFEKGTFEAFSKEYMKKFDAEVMDNGQMVLPALAGVFGVFGSSVGDFFKGLLGMSSKEGEQQPFKLPAASFFVIPEGAIPEPEEPLKQLTEKAGMAGEFVDLDAETALTPPEEDELQWIQVPSELPLKADGTVDMVVFSKLYDLWKGDAKGTWAACGEWVAAFLYVESNGALSVDGVCKTAGIPNASKELKDRIAKTLTVVEAPSSKVSTPVPGSEAPAGAEAVASASDDTAEPPEGPPPAAASSSTPSDTTPPKGSTLDRSPKE